MPPKRMSDVLASSSIDTRISSPLPTAATDASEGPTLPIIGAPSEHDTTTTGNVKKRKRPTSTATRPSKPSKAAAVERGSVKERRTNHPGLYEPWTLLPPKERKAIEARGTDKVEVVVWSKNQNVKSGITRLLRLLGAQSTTEEQDTPAVPYDEESVVAVSAQGEGTVKLVGIVDMVRRIAGEHRKNEVEVEEEGEAGREGSKWWVYMVLSSVEVPRRRSTSDAARGQEQDVEEEAEAMDVDGGEDGGAVKETQRSGQEETKRVPVLSVWMTRKRMVGWREVFGEQELLVYGSKDGVTT